MAPRMTLLRSSTCRADPTRLRLSRVSEAGAAVRDLRFVALLLDLLGTRADRAAGRTQCHPDTPNPSGARTSSISVRRWDCERSQPAVGGTRVASARRAFGDTPPTPRPSTDRRLCTPSSAHESATCSRELLRPYGHLGAMPHVDMHVRSGTIPRAVDVAITDVDRARSRQVDSGETCVVSKRPRSAAISSASGAPGRARICASSAK